MWQAFASDFCRTTEPGHSGVQAWETVQKLADWRIHGIRALLPGTASAVVLEVKQDRLNLRNGFSSSQLRRTNTVDSREKSLGAGIHHSIVAPWIG
jgi:hypothetical protein